METLFLVLFIIGSVAGVFAILALIAEVVERLCDE